MDRKTTFIGLGLIVIGVCFIGYLLLRDRSKAADIISDELAWDLRDSSPRKKVIITNDGVVARYVREDDTSYIGDIQDDFIVAKKDARVETWYAYDGKGVVMLSEPGKKPVYAAPDSLSDVIGKLEHIKGDCPESYCVEGYRDGWFAIDMDGSIGYIQEDYVFWDAIDTN